MTTYAGVGPVGAGHVDAGHVGAGHVGAGAVVPGDPDAVESLARRFRRTAEALRTDVDLLRGTLVLDGWDGPAARTCAETTRHIPRDLARAAASFTAVAAALADYAETLRLAQVRGGVAAADAAFLRERLSVGPFDLPPLPTDEAALAQARRREQLQQDLALAVARMAAARDEVDEAARRAAARVAAACDAPYERPGLLARAVDGVGDWVEQHATTITTIADLLSAVAGLAGMLSLVPGLTWLAGVAAVAGVVSVTLQAMLAMRGKARWQTVVTDGLNQLVPAARVVPAGRLASPAARQPAARGPVARRDRRREQLDGIRRDRTSAPCG